ncbi:conserved Plasmodium protein, unknown function [Plasmodium sp. DRC-Itaito]|nr:conserved Plasmodium protein, unknown function [Plasmodium sp. DRC-Itaito]
MIKKKEKDIFSLPIKDNIKTYIYCKNNNFNNLVGLYIEKKMFYINIILSKEYNEEKKNIGKKEKQLDTENRNKFKLYYIDNDEKICIDQKVEYNFISENKNICDDKEENMNNIFVNYIPLLWNLNFLFFFKIYIHNVLSNVHICIDDRPNETFFEFYHIFKNKKKKIYQDNSDENMTDIYCDVSQQSGDSDYNYFYEKANEFNYLEDEEFIDENEEEKKYLVLQDNNNNISYNNNIININDNYNNEYNKNYTEESYNYDICNIKKYSYKKKSLYSIHNNHNSNDFNHILYEKRHSNISIDEDKKKKKTKRFKKYLCQSCKNKINQNLLFNYNHVCLLQIFFSNLTKKELFFWASLKYYLEHFLGNIKSYPFYKGHNFFVETPYIEETHNMMDIPQNILHHNYLYFLIPQKKKKYILLLKKKKKIIKCLFENSINSLRISIKYIFTPNCENETNDTNKRNDNNNNNNNDDNNHSYYHFSSIFKRLIKKYKKFINKFIFNNIMNTQHNLQCNYNNSYFKSIHNHLNPIVLKNKTKKNYDFSILIHNIHIEIYGYIFLRNYIFFLIIMIELYLFIFFNHIGYTYTNNTNIFLEQLLKNLFT